jgi:hypothetical protein
MRKFFIIAFTTIFITGLLLFCIGYFGERNFSTLPDALPPVAVVVKNARTLKYVPYDPLMGKHGNIGAHLGFIVCSDVPNIAYGLSGYSLRILLENDFRRNSSAYNTSQGNIPGNPYFHRRARNLFVYFKQNGLLAPASMSPKSGDLAFYSRTPNGYISHVALVTEVRKDNFMVMESAPETYVAQEITGASVIKRGWILVGFGRMYKN